MVPRILLSTTVQWPSGARLAGAFATVGAQVDALYPAGHVKAKSRFVSGHHIYNPLFPLPSLARAIEAASPDLIVPCDDRAVRQLLALYHRNPHSDAGSLIAFSLGRIESYPALFSRSSFIAAALSEGIAAPATIGVDDIDTLELALVEIGFPAVLKSDGSWGGGGVVIARAREQAHDAYRRLSSAPSRMRSIARTFRRKDTHFLLDALSPPHALVSVQRFVAGEPATTSIACWQGRVLAGFHMDVLETSYATGPASVMRHVECPQMEVAAQRLAARFRLSGLHGLDFVRDAAGKAHLIETNPRATQSSALALGPGHDLVAALAGCITPSARGARPLVTTNEVFALFPQEWRRDPNSAWLRTAHLDVPWDDPDVLKACLNPGEPAPELPKPVRAPAALPQALTAD
ncbi:MAG: ATP-grasp domain-containing protein [Rhizomicrobium sp.]